MYEVRENATARWQVEEQKEGEVDFGCLCKAKANVKKGVAWAELFHVSAIVRYGRLADTATGHPGGSAVSGDELIK
ncbi:uncharacterized protein BP5553_08180 [Venustampulla echinocandica]|uniref:Uncharacterized protein n=1 Tax=Venustampulla echinocandica TaxID=2656787 RepID=A0A370TFY9_9HELO|nr:uncharacterized protein BP5553_08180 [Venustampulla echinocandica]RDL33812.1 hypothetical protein BP5553_08180 [Venustampulla echinocandica]